MADEQAYVPEPFDDRHVKVLVRLRECVVCKKPTVPKLQAGNSPFPAYYKANLENQLQRAGVSLIGSWLVSEPVCVACHEAGAATAECTLCHEQRKLSDMEESIGLDAEHMCKPCYATVPAKAWRAELDRLNEAHRWDFE